MGDYSAIICAMAAIVKLSRYEVQKKCISIKFNFGKPLPYKPDFSSLRISGEYSKCDTTDSLCVHRRPYITPDLL